MRYTNSNFRYITLNYSRVSPVSGLRGWRETWRWVDRSTEGSAAEPSAESTGRHTAAVAIWVQPCTRTAPPPCSSPRRRCLVAPARCRRPRRSSRAGVRRGRTPECLDCRRGERRRHAVPRPTAECPSRPHSARVTVSFQLLLPPCTCSDTNETQFYTFCVEIYICFMPNFLAPRNLGREKCVESFISRSDPSPRRKYVRDRELDWAWNLDSDMIFTSGEKVWHLASIFDLSPVKGARCSRRSNMSVI